MSMLRSSVAVLALVKVIGGCTSVPVVMAPMPTTEVPAHASGPIPSGGGCPPFESLVPPGPRPETAKVSDLLIRAGYVTVKVENGRTTWRCARTRSPSVASAPMPSYSVPRAERDPVSPAPRAYPAPQAPRPESHVPATNYVPRVNPPVPEPAARRHPSSAAPSDEPLALPSPRLSKAPSALEQRSSAPIQGFVPEGPARDPRALAQRLLPERVNNRAAWAADIVSVLETLKVPSSTQYICATMAVIAQESGFQVDPVVPGLPRIVWDELERRRDRYGVPTVLLETAVSMRSPDGRTYKARIDAVRTERELSAIFEDFIQKVPLGGRLFGHLNPVRTLGPMQVSVDFIDNFAKEHPERMLSDSNLRAIGFSRRGGIYFGAAHLFAYAAPYDAPIYRFADYNAGRYASRNAALQNAIARLSGIPLVLDGIVVARDASGTRSSETIRAALSLGPQLGLDQAQMLRDLQLSGTADLERTALYIRVFEQADQRAGRTVPRALIPQVKLSGPKIHRRNLTTKWFAERVDSRYRACLARADAQSLQARNNAAKALMAGW